MAESVVNTVRCPHCGSPDVVLSRPRFSVPDLVCRVVGFEAFRCRGCFERFFSRRTAAKPVEAPKVETASEQPVESNGGAGKRGSSSRKELAKMKTAFAQQAEQVKRAEKETAALRAETAAAKTALAREMQRASELESDLAKAAAAPPEPPAMLEDSASAELDKLHLENARLWAAVGPAEDRSAQLEKELGVMRIETEAVAASFARESARAKQLDADLEAARVEGGRATQFEADLAAAREESARFAAELEGLREQNVSARLAEVEKALDEVDTLRRENATLTAALTQEVERRVRLERDLKDLREGWAYDLQRTRMSNRP
jgi:chromosome segregation ATPase